MCCYKGGKTDRIDKAIKLGLKTQEGYENVLEEMAEIRLKKVYQYGEDRYERGDIKFDMIMCYSDVYRKYILPLRSGLIKEKLNRRLNVSTLPQE